MPEQATSISSGISPLVKTAKPGQSDLTTNAENAGSKASAFSNDLDQARKQRLDTVRADAPQGEERKPGTEQTTTALKNRFPEAANTQTISRAGGDVSVDAVQPEEGHLSKAALVDESGVDHRIGNAIPVELAESDRPLLPTGSDALTGEAIQDTIPASVQLATGIAPGVESNGPAMGPVTTKLHEQSETEQTLEPLRAAIRNSQTSAVNSSAPESKAAGIGERAIMASPSGQLASGMGARKAEHGVVAPAVLSVDDDLDLTGGRVLKETALGVANLKKPLEQGAVLTNAAVLAKGRMNVSVDTGATATSTPEELATVAADKSSAIQVSVASLTQPAIGNGIVTQATLAGRLRHLSNDTTAQGARAPQTAGQTGLTLTALSSLNGKGHEQQAGAAVPAALVDESQSGMDSLMGVADMKQTVQQRIAMTEAILSQMAQDAGEVTVKTPGADNILQALSGNTASTPVLQSSALASGPVVQAPLNINLMSADADTALAGNVKWMTNEGVKNAVMTVTPHGMGPISVKIGIDGNQMDVSIIASQHSTRDALESMLPRLREQLAVQGHETVKVDVSDGKSEQARSGNGQTFAESRNPAGASPQDNQSNSSNHGETTEYGRSGDLEVGSDSVMAEDLQRDAARVVGDAGSRPVFDAYV